MNLREIFPETIFDLPRHEQLDKVQEELDEARREIGNDCRYVEELIDIMQATATALYKSGATNEEIERALIEVRKKNGDRGYYVEGRNSLS